MTIEEKLKDLVLARYPSVREFTKLIGMPNSTFVSIMKRGINNSNITNIIDICNALDIEADALAEGKIVERKHDIKELPIDMLTKEEFDMVKSYISLILLARQKNKEK